jgi:two-component system, cell cycle sensor histidine kinase and response regulator CckA
MSGYTEDVIVRHGVDWQEASFLQKPVAPAKLAARIRAVRDEGRAAPP